MITRTFWGFVSAFYPFQVFLILPGTYVLSIFASCWINCVNWYSSHHHEFFVNRLQIVMNLFLFNCKNANNGQTWRNMWRQRSFCASGCPAILLMKPAKINDYNDQDDWWEEPMTMIMMKRWWWWYLLIKPSRPARRSSMKSSSNMPWIKIMSYKYKCKWFIVSIKR